MEGSDLGSLAFSDHYMQDWTTGPPFEGVYGHGGTSAFNPTWRVIGLRPVGTLIPGHDVSGTG